MYNTNNDQEAEAEAGGIPHVPPHLGCSVSRGPSVPHFELLPATGSVMGHTQVDHTVKVGHSHLPPPRAGAGVNSFMRTVYGLLQENVGSCMQTESK